ncbi:MAG: hypothetical protein QJQ54_02740 [Mollicutes bacterium]|nr:MAG: hypothetical protein QJQ54_02740 [Mollicutes bacterium]
MQNFINIQLFSINKLIFHGELISINLRTDRSAYITLLPNHSPLITNLTDSKISLHLNRGKTQFFNVETGVFYFADNKAYLIANKATLMNK